MVNPILHLQLLTIVVDELLYDTKNNNHSYSFDEISFKDMTYSW